MTTPDLRAAAQDEARQLAIEFGLPGELAQSGLQCEKLARLIAHVRAAPSAVAAEDAREHGLHPATQDLVRRFSAALSEKLAAAQQKYGYSDGWMRSDWMDECRQHLRAHVEKGDPRDVAAYCAFLWHHGESTATQMSRDGGKDIPFAVASTEELSSACLECGGTGMRDSGGFHPWGEAALEPCECSSAPHPAPAVAEPSRSQKMRDAGFTRRDERLTCDECGNKFSAQFLPLHKCEIKAVAQSEEWVAEAAKTLDRLGAFLQKIGAPWACEWRDWIDNAENMLVASAVAAEAGHGEQEMSIRDIWDMDLFTQPAPPSQGQTLAAELKGKSDTAYCKCIETLRRTECLGWEHKVKHGTFGEAELKAHTLAAEYLGMHRAYADARALVAAPTQPPAEGG